MYLNVLFIILIVFEPQRHEGHKVALRRNSYIPHKSQQSQFRHFLNHRDTATRSNTESKKLSIVVLFPKTINPGSHFLNHRDRDTDQHREYKSINRCPFPKNPKNPINPINPINPGSDIIHHFFRQPKRQSHSCSA